MEKEKFQRTLADRLRFFSDATIDLERKKMEISQYACFAISAAMTYGTGANIAKFVGALSPTMDFGSIDYVLPLALTLTGAAGLWKLVRINEMVQEKLGTIKFVQSERRLGRYKISSHNDTYNLP